MKTGFLVSVLILNLVFVLRSFAQEQDAKETIEKAMQQIKHVTLEQIRQGEGTKVLDIAAQGGSQEYAGPKDMNLVEIEGTIRKIAEDGSYILVDETNIITDSDFLSYNPFNEGDKVVVMATLTNEGIKAIGINLADKGEEEVSEEAEQQDAEGIESEDYISDDTQKDDSLEESLIEEIPSEDMSDEATE